MAIHAGFSKDAIHWELDDKVIFNGYDPRICEIEGRYYLSWVNLTPHGTTIGIAVTDDFETWEQLEDATYPVARNGVLFPRKINGEYVLLVRPCDRGHTPYGDIFIQHSPDLKYWGKYRFVMGPVRNWEMTKVGAGPTPIETDIGWLAFYHGVITSCNGFTYSKSGNNPLKFTVEGKGLLLLFNTGIFPPDVAKGGMVFVTAWWGVWHIVSGLILGTVFRFSGFDTLSFSKFIRKK